MVQKSKGPKGRQCSHPAPPLEATRMILKCPSEQDCVFTGKPECVLFRARFKPRSVSGSGLDIECLSCPGGDVGPLKASIPPPGPLSPLPLCPPPPPSNCLSSSGCSRAWALVQGPAQRLGRAVAGLGRPLRPNLRPTSLSLTDAAQCGETARAKAGRPE